jgi:UPF0716 protein FxsA
MLFKLMLLFVIVPVIELAVLIKVGGVIGTFNTVAIILVTGLWGAVLAKSQGIQVLQRMRENMLAGILPTEELFNGAMVLVGGALLLTPGFVTDLLGLIFLIPQTRFLIKEYLKRWIQRKIDSGQIITYWGKDGF